MEVVGETDTGHKGYLRGAGREISQVVFYQKNPNKNKQWEDYSFCTYLQMSQEL